LTLLTLGIRDYCSSQCYALLLATREEEASLANMSVVAFGKILDEIMGIGLLGRAYNALPLVLLTVILKIGADQAMADILENCRPKELWLLANQSHLRPKPSQVERLDIMAIHTYCSSHGVIKSLE
jgi:hypothetical protein